MTLLPFNLIKLLVHLCKLTSGCHTMPQHIIRLKIFLNELVSVFHYCYSIFLSIEVLTSTPKTQAKDPNIHITKEVIQLANEHIKRCSTSYVIKYWKLKQRDAIHLLEWLKSGTLKSPNAGEDIEQQEFSFTAHGSVNQYIPFGSFLQNQTYSNIRSIIVLLGI